MSNHLTLSEHRLDPLELSNIMNDLLDQINNFDIY